MKHAIVDKVVVTYTQDSDDADTSNIGSQELEISAFPALVGLYKENGAKDYYIVLKTDRWAVENPEELQEIIKDFESRVKNK